MKFVLPFLFVSLVLLVGCATNPLNSFSEIREGMDKTQVIDRIGSPLRSDRKDGVDHWVYRFFEGNQKIYKEVQFVNDIVSYVGNLQDPSTVAPTPKAKKQLLEDAIKKSAPKKDDPTFEEI